MKYLIFFGLVATVFNGFVTGDEELAERLKPYEQFSPYKWTKWLELRPPASGVAAAVAYTQPARPQYSEDDESEESGEDSLEQWFRRAILPQLPPDSPVTRGSKKNSKSDTASPKPTIVPASFWGPPPTTVPNETVILPPGYWAAKKSMFVAKLFEALAMSVLNSTGPPTEAVTTTTISPRDKILNELSTVLLSDVARSLPPTSDETEEVTEEPSDEDPADESEDSREDEEEKKPVHVQVPKKKAKSPGPTTPLPTTPAPTTTTVDPILLGKLEFLSKLSAAIAEQQAKLASNSATTTGAPAKKEGKKALKSKKKSGKKTKGPTTPKWMKFVPTTTTTPAPPTINYDALAKALLGDQ